MFDRLETMLCSSSSNKDTYVTSELFDLFHQIAQYLFVSTRLEQRFCFTIKYDNVNNTSLCPFSLGSSVLITAVHITLSINFGCEFVYSYRVMA